MFYVAVCVGEYGALCLPGGGERGLTGCWFEAQPDQMFQRWERLGHTAALLNPHCHWQQVGGRSFIISLIIFTIRLFSKVEDCNGK